MINLRKLLLLGYMKFPSKRAMRIVMELRNMRFEHVRTQ